jgi:hypothetical protein
VRYQARVWTEGKSKLVDLESAIAEDARKEYERLEGAVEFVERYDHPAAERKAVMAFLASPQWERMDEEEAAEAIISALNMIREGTQRYVVVANLQWPDCPDFHLFASGPFNTEKQAEAIGQRFSADPATQRGKGRWRVVPILPPRLDSAKSAWSKVKPEPVTPCCSLHHGWLKDELGQMTWVKYDENKEHWREKAGW